MKTVEETIEVEVPVRTAYNQWTQFEEFPRFMSGVESVKQIDDTHLHWKAKIGGVEREWDATITDQIPDKRIAWKADSGTENAGVVTFQPVDAGKTKVTVQLTVDGEGAMEKVGEKLGVVDHQVSSDMKKFKETVESQGQETGAWRGEV